MIHGLQNNKTTIWATNPIMTMRDVALHQIAKVQITPTWAENKAMEAGTWNTRSMNIVINTMMAMRKPPINTKM